MNLSVMTVIFSTHHALTAHHLQ